MTIRVHVLDTQHVYYFFGGAVYWEECSFHHLIRELSTDWLEFVVDPKTQEFDVYIESERVALKPYMKIQYAFALTGFGPSQLCVTGGTVEELFGVIYDMKIPEEYRFKTDRTPDTHIYDSNPIIRSYKTYGELFKDWGRPADDEDSYHQATGPTLYVRPANLICFIDWEDCTDYDFVFGYDR